MLYTLAMLALTSMRVIFAGYLKRQLDLIRSGKQAERTTGKQTAIFLLAFTVVGAIIAVIL